MITFNSKVNIVSSKTKDFSFRHGLENEHKFTVVNNKLVCKILMIRVDASIDKMSLC